MLKHKIFNCTDTNTQPDMSVIIIIIIIPITIYKNQFLITKKIDYW